MLMKMSKAVLAIVAALATSAAVVEGAVETFEPASFNTDRVGSPVVMYTFQQSECADNAFTDAVSDDLIGGMSYASSWTSDEKCPSYTDSGTSYEFPIAYNGAHFQGISYQTTSPAVEVPDEIVSGGTVESLDTVFARGSGGFTFEFWIQPSEDFKSGADLATGETVKYLLMEIGPNASFTAGDSYDYAVGVDFSIQIYLQMTSTSSTIFVSYYASVDQTEYTASAYSVLSNSQSYPVDVGIAYGNYYHIVITKEEAVSGDVKPMPGYFTSSADGVTSGKRLSADMEFPETLLADSYLRLGSSPIILADTYNTEFVSFAGDILFFALHDTPFSQANAEANYAAGLPNSAPVVTSATTGQLDVDEDATGTVLDLSDFVYDVDVSRSSQDAPSMVLTGSDTSGSVIGASVTIDGTAVNLTADLPQTITSTVTFAALPDTFGLGTDLLFSAVDVYDAYALENVTVAMGVDPMNDDPEALTNSSWTDYTSQSTYSEITFSGYDQDCPISGFTESYRLTSCSLYGAAKTFTVYTPGYESSSSSPLGRLYEPDETDGCTGGLEQAITDGRDIATTSPYSKTITQRGVQSFTLCFEACLGTVEDDPSLENPCPSELNNASDLGDAIFSFTVTDAFGAVSNEVNVSTAVTSVLDANVGDNLIVIEDNVTMVQLNGTDNYCEQDPVPSDCTDRTMTFMLTEQIPESQGQLFLDEDMTVPLDINVEFNGTFYILPAENYYSVDSWPLCSSGTAYSMSLCPDGNLAIGDTEYPFTCTGPFCTGAYANRYARFTTSDLNQVVMGNATSELCTSTGCPIKITYKILIDSEGLESTAASGASIYVSNVNDAPEIVIPVSSMTNLVRNTYYDFADDNGAVIQLTDSDANSRIIDAIVQVRNTEGRISISEELVMDSDRFVYKRGGGVISSGASDVRMTGTLSEINRVLAVLRYRSTSADISDAITITVFDTTRGVDLTNGFAAYDGVIYNEVIGTVSISVQAESDDDGVQLTLPTLAIYGMIGGGALCCIGFCVGLVCAIASCAQRGNRTARWILHHVLCSTIKSTGDDLGEEMQSAAKFTEAAVHAEHARLTKVVWCAKFMHCMCPCCVKFSPENSAVPDEEQMMVAVTDRLRHERASQHIPKDTREKSVRLVVPPEDLFNWERHMHHDEETGRDIPYYFNSKTNQSSWHRPKVRDHADPPDEV